MIHASALSARLWRGWLRRLGGLAPTRVARPPARPRTAQHRAHRHEARHAGQHVLQHAEAVHQRLDLQGALGGAHVDGRVGAAAAVEVDARRSYWALGRERERDRAARAYKELYVCWWPSRWGGQVWGLGGEGGDRGINASHSLCARCGNICIISAALEFCHGGVTRCMIVLRGDKRAVLPGYGFAAHAVQPARHAELHTFLGQVE